MVGSSWSSSSSCTSSFGSLDEDVICVVNNKPADAAAEGSVKFLCSYGGRILPRNSDGALRYVGGHNRVLSVDRSLDFYELQRKLRVMCGWDDVSLRCQLPTEDLDALVSVTSDDDLANLLEEYDATSRDRLQPLKIRAFLFPISPPSAAKLLPASRAASTDNAVHHLHRQNSTPAAAARVSPTFASFRWWHAPSPPPHQQVASRSARAAVAHHLPHRNLVHNGSHWQ